MELTIIILALLGAAAANIFLKQKILIEMVSVGASVIAFCVALLLALRVAEYGTYTPSAFFLVDALSAIALLIIGLVGSLTSLYSVFYLRVEMTKKIIGFTRVKEYFVLLDVFLVAMAIAVTANNPIFAWIALEATTLSTAFLISFYNKPSALEGAWKYLMLNSIGLLLGFFGTILYFTALDPSVHGGFIDWQTLLTQAGALDPAIAKVAFIFVLLGYGTKVGLAPVHTWLPDAHSKAPAPISALMSGVLLTVALILVLKFKIITDTAVGQTFSSHLLIAVGLLSIAIAAFIMLVQKNYKRLVAYSSIENMGVMAIGFGLGGVGVYAALLHMIYNAFIKSAIFMAAGTLFLRYSTTKIANVRGALTALPATGIIFIVGFLAITGMPPFGVFLTKFYILSAALTTSPYIAVPLLLFLSMVFIGFFRHVVTMFFGAVPEDIKTGEVHTWLVIPPAILLCLVFVISLYIPPFLNTLIHNAIELYTI